MNGWLRKVLFITGAVTGIVFGVYAFLKLEPGIFIPLAVTFVTAVGGLGATLWTTIHNKKQQVDADFREKKVEIYLSFVQLLAGLMQANKGTDAKEPPQDMVEALIDIRTKATLWSSPGVLMALNELGKSDEKDTKRLFHAVDRVQREMRLDLGLSNEELEELFFIKHLLKSEKDVDELLKMMS